MGPVQVLRVAVVAASLGASLGTAPAAPAAPAPAAKAIPIAVIDLRAGADDAARRDLLAALQHAALTPVGGDLGIALTGRDLDLAAALAALGEAQDGFGQLDCGRARPSAEHAAVLLTARTAAGFDDRAPLARAWAYVTLCAERDGDRSTARFATERLRALGFGADGALPADVWARYPEIDAATDRDIVELTVTGPPGTLAWIDERAVGPTPATGFVAAGKHVIAVAAGPVRGARLVTALGKALTLDVAAGTLGDDADVAELVRRGQVAGAVDAAAVTTVLGRARVELAATIGPDGQATLWQRRDGVAVVVMTGTAAELATAAQAAWAAAHDRGPDPGRDLLRDGDGPTANPASDRAPTRWWVYAAIGGAIAVGAAAILAVEGGDDHQRFELVFP